MANINEIEINGTTYTIEDTEAREGSGGGGGESPIPAENVSETEISEEVDYARYGVWKDNTYLGTNGQESTSALWTASDYIEATSADKVKLLSDRNNYSLIVCCYDSNKDLLQRSNSGYTTANVELEVSLAEGTAYIRITCSRVFIFPSVSSHVTYIKFPITYTVRDWQDTTYNRMNQLAVRADIYSKIEALETLMWNYKKWEGKYIVADGNSLVAAAGWLENACAFLGATAVNLGKSGSAITRPDQPSTGATIAQKQAYIVNNIDTNYPANADLILLQESSYLDGNYYDQMDGENPTDSWCARMNYFIRCLKTKYPNVLIALMPDPTWYKAGIGGGGNDSATNTTIVDQIFNSRNRESYEVMKGLAEYNRLAFLDVDHSTPFNPLMKANYYAQYYHLHEQYPTIKQDGVHPYRPYNSAKGYAIAHFIAGLLFNPDAPNDAQQNWTSMIYTINADGTCTYPDVD